MPDKPYVPFQQPDGWYFQRADGSRSKCYPTQVAADAAARFAQQSEDVNRAAKHLARTYFAQPHLPLTILRVGFEKLGRERLRDFRLSATQRRQVLGVSLSRTIGVTGDAELPIAYRRYAALHHDLSALDFEPLLDRLLADSADLITAMVEQVRDDGAADRRIGGNPAWQWVASLLASPQSGVGRDLDDLLANGAVQTPELSRLGSVRTRCALASHVHLVAYVMRELFPVDIESPTQVRAHLVDCLGNSSESVVDALRQEVQDCRAAVKRLALCRASGAPLKGGMMSKEVAECFLGFSELTLAWERFAAFSRTELTPQTCIPEDRPHSSGPKMIDYAGDEWSSRSAWDAIPSGAGVLRPQGQTRSPKGHRA